MPEVENQAESLRIKMTSKKGRSLMKPNTVKATGPDKLLSWILRK